jgi:hypothetical protein
MHVGKWSILCAGLLCSGACAEGAPRGGGAGVVLSGDAAADSDASSFKDTGPPDGSAPPVPMMDGGRPDTGAPGDAGTRPDAGRPDAGGDTGTRDGGGDLPCVPMEEVCNGEDDDCDFAVDEPPGSGQLCALGELCIDGGCVPASDCPTGSSDCDGDEDNGCEVDHATAATTCEAAPSVGGGCGDTACDWFCPPTDWTDLATHRGRAGAFFKMSIEECSGCCADISARLQLAVPAGIDYDLYVHQSCGTILDSSRNGAGRAEEVIVTDVDDCAGVTNYLEFWVEVRYVGGFACGEWVLSLSDTSCSA